MRDTDGENTEHRVARPNLRIVITFGLFSIINSKIWSKPFKGKLAVRDRSVFLHHPSKHVPLKTVIPLLSNWFPNSIQIKLISQRLSSTTRLNWRRQAHKHEFNGKIKSKPLKTLGTVHVVYVYLSNTPILILLSSKQKMPQCLVESLNSFNWCMESICNRSLLLRHFSFERQMARKVSSKFKWAGILWIISQFSSWNWQCNGLSAVKTTARQHSNCARNRVQFKKIS